MTDERAPKRKRASRGTVTLDSLTQNLIVGFTTGLQEFPQTSTVHSIAVSDQFISGYVAVGREELRYVVLDLSTGRVLDNKPTDLNLAGSQVTDSEHTYRVAKRWNDTHGIEKVLTANGEVVASHEMGKYDVNGLVVNLATDGQLVYGVINNSNDVVLLNARDMSRAGKLNPRVESLDGFGKFTIPPCSDSMVLAAVFQGASVGSLERPPANYSIAGMVVDGDRLQIVYGFGGRGNTVITTTREGDVVSRLDRRFILRNEKCFIGAGGYLAIVETNGTEHPKSENVLTLVRDNTVVASVDLERLYTPISDVESIGYQNGRLYLSVPHKIVSVELPKR